MLHIMTKSEGLTNCDVHASVISGFWMNITALVSVVIIRIPKPRRRLNLSLSLVIQKSLNLYTSHRHRLSFFKTLKPQCE
jgi:hypothetical protein